jgi:hypothetical protein
MARRGRPSNSQAVVFIIYTTNKNKPQTNIELPADWSFYPSEQEVLLFPFFCFLVVNIEQQEEEGVIYITIAEIPKQNYLTIKPVEMSRIIWVDNNVFSPENNKYRLRLEDEFKSTGFSFATSIFEAVNQVNSTVKTVLLVSG